MEERELTQDIDIIESDVCIIGSGPGGAAVFHKLAHRSNQRLLLLEAGPDISHIPTRKTYRKTQVARWQHAWHPFSRFRPSVFENVGGASKFYAAALFRFSPEDFEERAYGTHVSPAWPVTYAQMEPFYGQAERLYKVHGNTGDDQRGLPRSRPYPHKGIGSEKSIDVIAKGMAQMGWDPFTTPVGLEKFDDKRQAITADAQTSCIDPILKSGRPGAHLMAGWRVRRLVKGAERGKSPHISEAVIENRQGITKRVRAKLFVLAAGASGSPLLLQDSGIESASGLIGANYMFHQHTLVPVIDASLAPVIYAKTLAFNRFYFPQPDGGGALGHVQIMGAMTPQLVQAYAGGWTRWLTRFVRSMTDNMVLFLVSTEDLPLAENRVQRQGKAGVRLTYKPTLEAAHAKLVRRFIKDLRGVVSGIDDLDDRGFVINRTLTGALPPLGPLKHSSLTKNFKYASNAHQCGTLKMGRSPSDSVVDATGRFWELSNLYVADASVFPSSAHLNPTLTIVANALRIAEAMVRVHKL